ncbi:hypothetical protein RND81_13G043900 [Saponaria officinalis]|uniref:Uncharacterized protein n=1 Tax=Saponaria officinalis TaxID=3572 RepID=A0AAW1H431_SAPOF
MDYLSIVLCLLLAWVAVHRLLSRGRYSKSKTTILPPGPRPLPIFGNLFSLGNKPHSSLAELARIHGPLMLLQLGRVPTVVISSAVMAKEALQKNDIAFSSRYIIDSIRAVNHHENSVAWLPVESQWRNLRKICYFHVVSTSRLDACQSLRRDKLKHLLSYVKNCSDAQVAINIGQATFTTALNFLSSTFFSMDMGDPTSEFALQFRNTIRDYIDPQGIRRRTSVHLQKMIDLFQKLIDERLQGERPLESMQAGNDVLDELLGINQEKTAEIEPSMIPHLLFDLFAAGTDTTSSTLEWAMAELLHNPEKLKKAQLELQEIVGKGNTLEESDISQLPYLQAGRLVAIIKETLRPRSFRLHPPVPLLLPRKVDSDVRLFRFTVPKNAQVIVNAWAIGRDPEIWQKPDLFEPERFLGSKIDVKGRDFELIPFGAGRRICAGLPLATRMMPLMLGSLIHGFNWKLNGGVLPEDMNMEEKLGITLEKAQRLYAIPVRV